MEKAMLFLPVFVLLVSMVCAGDGWEDINSGNGSEDVFVEEVVIDDVYPETEVSVSSGGSTKFTRDFYIALVVSGVGILIILLFLYLFLRGPKNKWDKKN